jgi:HSP20 family protein
MSEPSAKKKIKITPIILAVLVVIVLLQSVMLIRQSQQQAPPQQAASIQQEPVSPMVRPRPHPMASRIPNALPPGMMSQDPWEVFENMSQRMNSLMQHAFTFGSPLFQKMPQGAGFDFTPAVDLEETKDAYIVRSDLPGLEKDKIDLTVKENVLTIEGAREITNETQNPQSGYYAQERSYGSFARSLNLPGPVDESKIVAEYKNGVLTITLPKAPGEQDVQKVPIR